MPKRSTNITVVTTTAIMIFVVEFNLFSLPTPKI